MRGLERVTSAGGSGCCSSFDLVCCLTARRKSTMRCWVPFRVLIMEAAAELRLVLGLQASLLCFADSLPFFFITFLLVGWFGFTSV